MLIHRALMAAGVGAMVALTGTVAHAQTLTTFAQSFDNGNTPVGPYIFTNAGASSSLGVAGGSVPLSFMYTVANGYGPQYDPTNATLSVSGVVSGPATINSGTVTQNFSSITFAYTADTAVNGQTNLLTATFTASPNSSIALQGTLSGGAATFSASDVNGAGVADYTSSFLTFTNAHQTTTSEQFSVSLSGVNNTPSGDAGPTVNGNGYVDSFEGDGTSTFSANQIPQSQTPNGVPEPMAAALLAVGAIGLVRGRRVHRRR